jgi:outer membrane protein, multidrug efflux system
VDAERNLFAAQLDLAQTQSDTIVTLINIYKALGGGWVVAADYNK